MWAALGFTRAPLYTGVTWKAQNQAAVLLAAGAKGHRYSFPHAKISTAPPILNRVFGQTVDAQLQANELVYATKYYAAILARATGKPLDVCQKEYLSRKRWVGAQYWTLIIASSFMPWNNAQSDGEPFTFTGTSAWTRPMRRG
jgi:ATP-dependent protease ClpP protease subunit